MSLHVHRFGTGRDRHYFGIHGWGGGWRTFEPLAEYLPKDATLWSVDLPGYGDSARLAHWRWEALVDELVSTITTLDAPPLRLLGNCSGAAFGLAAVLRTPERFEQLFLLDAFASFPWYFDLLMARGVGRLFYATAFANPIGRWMANRGLSAHRTGEADLTSSFEDLDHGVVYQHLRMLHEMPGYRMVQPLRHPVVIAHGERTFGAVRGSVPRWLEIWPEATVVEIAGAGHLPIQEATAELARHVFA